MGFAKGKGRPEMVDVAADDAPAVGRQVQVRNRKGEGPGAWRHCALGLRDGTFVVSQEVAARMVAQEPDAFEVVGPAEEIVLPPEPETEATSEPEPTVAPGAAGGAPPEKDEPHQP